MVTAPLRIALIGDYDASVAAHQAIPAALALAGEGLSATICHEWVPTADICEASRLDDFDGVWCVPGSPYRNMDGALLAIRFAREQRRAFLGTCGGLQHAIIEYARNVLGWADAEHAESAPNARMPVITPLSCALVETSDTIHFRAGSQIEAAYGQLQANESYHCRFGVSPAFASAISSGPMQVVAEDSAGEIRAVELKGHPFFVATLFQPERRALTGKLPPLIVAFVRAAMATRTVNSESARV